MTSQFHQRNYLALSRGDAVVHQSNLFYGVQVLDNVTLDADEIGSGLITPGRWSWILWFLDQIVVKIIVNHGMKIVPKMVIQHVKCFTPKHA